MNRFTAAVVGAGFIGPVHVEALRRAGVTVRGILASTEQETSVARSRYGIDVGYSDYAALLSDPAVQVVHLATPNHLHYRQALAALRAGKHLVCEKPLAMTSQESAELIQVARQSGRAAAVNYNIRYYPLCQELAARVKEGSLGPIEHVAGSYVQDWLLYPTDYNWRVLSEQGGALRAIADIGTHWMDLVQFVLQSKIVSVCADLQTVHPERFRPAAAQMTFGGAAAENVPREPIPIDTEDVGNVLLKFANGARGVMWVSQVTAGRKNCLRVELTGRKHAAAWDSERPNEIWLGHRDRPSELLLRDPALLSRTARKYTDYPGGHNEGFPDTFKQCFRAFYGSLARGDFLTAGLFPSLEDGHYEILVCEAILKSHRERRWIDIGEESR